MATSTRGPVHARSAGSEKRASWSTSCHSFCPHRPRRGFNICSPTTTSYAPKFSRFHALPRPQTLSTADSAPCDVAEKGRATTWSTVGAAAVSVLGATAAHAAEEFSDAVQAGAQSSIVSLDFWKGFYLWRVDSPVQALLTIFGPFAATFAVFKVLIEKKKESCRKELAEGGYDIFLKERGVLIDEINDVKSLSYFRRLARVGKLSEDAVGSFVNDWKKREAYYSPLLSDQYKATRDAQREAAEDEYNDTTGTTNTSATGSAENGNSSQQGAVSDATEENNKEKEEDDSVAK